ncbi:hypothetical protein GCE86_26095 [Micromonospora terminaliae]|uniref:Lipoprotein n=1 Tax=Micromonospora terminaliae TaxID=1914461 RepID=A0AAJ2ZB13_9ACTN|nr:hypothetical protein [Micromonospora terminaliae]NES25976.1 hypothetical protein [Micromonospora terminaliae]QGL50186.1 hypothetical protein GCE86_26095 [Micromonospora terminaliae]
MRRWLVTPAVMLLGLFPAGCGTASVDPATADNTVPVCRDFRTIYERYSNGDAPERLAYVQAAEAAYKGNGKPGATSAAKAAYFQAWARDLRPVARQASDATLKTALNRAADVLDEVAGGRALTAADVNGTWQPLLDTCPATSPGASPTS